MLNYDAIVGFVGFLAARTEPLNELLLELSLANFKFVPYEARFELNLLCIWTSKDFLFPGAK